MVVQAESFDDGELELSARLADAVADQFETSTEHVVVDERLGEVNARLVQPRSE